MVLNEWEKIRIVRCVKDPILPGQRPRQAIQVGDIPDCDAYLHTPTGNVWFNFHKLKRQLMIGIGNIEVVEIIYGETENAAGEGPEDPQKKKLGRPRIIKQTDNEKRL